MLKDPRNLLWAIPLAALLTLPLWKPLAVGFLSPAQHEASSTPQSPANPPALSSSEMTGVQFEQSRNGTKEWLLTADRLYSTESDSDMLLEDVRALFYGTGGRNGETRISSQKARYDTETKQITLQGSVVVENGKGYEMQTDSLEYLAAQKKIRTTSSVKIRGSNIAVSGNQLVYDTATGDYTISGNVVCRIW